MARYPSPGARLAAWLSQTGQTQTFVARESSMSRRHVHRILRDEIRITPSLADRLERVTGVSRREWLRLSYMERVRRGERLEERGR